MGRAQTSTGKWDRNVGVLSYEAIRGQRVDQKVVSGEGGDRSETSAAIITTGGYTEGRRGVSGPSVGTRTDLHNGVLHRDHDDPDRYNAEVERALGSDDGSYNGILLGYGVHGQ